MDKLSNLGRALEEDAYHKRRNAAIDAWEKVQPADWPTHSGMPGDFQDLYECTLLNPEQLVVAKKRQIYLLKSQVENVIRHAGDLFAELQDLEDSLLEQLRAGNFYWCGRCDGYHDPSKNKVCPTQAMLDVTLPQVPTDGSKPKWEDVS